MDLSQEQVMNYRSLIESFNLQSPMVEKAANRLINRKERLKDLRAAEIYWSRIDRKIKLPEVSNPSKFSTIWEEIEFLEISIKRDCKTLGIDYKKELPARF